MIKYKKLLALLCVIVPLIVFIWVSIAMVGIAGTIKALLFTAVTLLLAWAIVWGVMVLLGEIE